MIWWTSDSTTPERSHFFHLIELDVDDFEQACLLIDGDSLIAGTELRTCASDDRRARHVIDRYPVAFRGIAVARVELPRWELIEEPD